MNKLNLVGVIKNFLMFYFLFLYSCTTVERTVSIQNENDRKILTNIPGGNQLKDTYKEYVITEKKVLGIPWDTTISPKLSLQELQKNKLSVFGIRFFIFGFLLSGIGLVVSVMFGNPVLQHIGLYAWVLGIGLGGSGYFLTLSANYWDFIPFLFLLCCGAFLIVKCWGVDLNQVLKQIKNKVSKKKILLE